MSKMPPTSTIEENLSQYLFDGSALWHFGSGRAVPFVFGGAGYMRELHDADALVEDRSRVSRRRRGEMVVRAIRPRLRDPR